MGRSLSRRHSCYHTDLARQRHQDRSTSSPFFVQLIEGLRPKQERGNATCSPVPTVGARIGHRGQSSQGVSSKDSTRLTWHFSEERGGGRQARSALSTDWPASWVETGEACPREHMGVHSGRAEPKHAGVHLASDHGTDPHTQVKQCIYVIDGCLSPVLRYV